MTATIRFSTPCGADFVAEVEPDYDMGFPWQDSAGHGAVREAAAPRYSNHRGATGKHPGEACLHNTGRTVWLYDFQEAVKTARADGWGSAGCRPGMTAGQTAAQAAKDGMEYCRDWLKGARWYVFAQVWALDAQGGKIGESNAMGGIESGDSAQARGYLRDTLQEMAGEILYAQQRAAQAAAAEATEAAYWASRDVLTGNPSAPAAYFIEA